MNSAKLNRVTWIDNAKGIGIFLVVLGHTFWGGRTLVYIFHMPLFFFLSGCLFKHSEALSYAERVKKCFNNIMIPYFTAALVSPLLKYTISGVEFSYDQIIIMILNGKRGELSFNAVLWFLPTLFCVEVLYFVLKKLVRNRIFVLLLFLVIGILLHSLCEKEWIWGGNNVFYYGVFYAIGDNYNTFLEEKRSVQIVRKICLFLMLIFFSMSTYWADCYTLYFGVQMNPILKSGLDILLALVGILGTVELALMIKSEKLSLIGQASFTIMVFHLFILEGLANLFLSFGIEVNQASYSYCLFATFLSICFLTRAKKVACIAESV